MELVISCDGGRTCTIRVIQAINMPIARAVIQRVGRNNCDIPSAVNKGSDSSQYNFSACPNGNWIHGEDSY